MINTRNREPGQMQGDTQEPTGPGREAESEGQRGGSWGCTGAPNGQMRGGGPRHGARGLGREHLWRGRESLHPGQGTHVRHRSGRRGGRDSRRGGAWDTRCTVFPRLRDTGPCSIKRNSIKYLRVNIQL